MRGRCIRRPEKTNERVNNCTECLATGQSGRGTCSIFTWVEKSARVIKANTLTSACAHTHPLMSTYALLPPEPMRVFVHRGWSGGAVRRTSSMLSVMLASDLVTFDNTDVCFKDGDAFMIRGASGTCSFLCGTVSQKIRG